MVSLNSLWLILATASHPSCFHLGIFSVLPRILTHPFQGILLCSINPADPLSSVGETDVALCATSILESNACMCPMVGHSQHFQLIFRIVPKIKKTPCLSNLPRRTFRKTHPAKPLTVPDTSDILCSLTFILVSSTSYKEARRFPNDDGLRSGVVSQTVVIQNKWEKQTSHCFPHNTGKKNLSVRSLPPHTN